MRKNTKVCLKKRKGNHFMIKISIQCTLEKNKLQQNMEKWADNPSAIQNEKIILIYKMKSFLEKKLASSVYK